VATAFIERPLDAHQVVEDGDENTVWLTATVLDTKELRRWLLEFGAEVVGPEALRAEMIDVIDRMILEYRNA
jgi:predicted DNA-binding transcriptional regulator YafY